MSKTQTQAALHARRARRVRYGFKQQANGRPRLSIHRSGRHMYAQIIDDAVGKTLASASTLDKEYKGKAGASIESAKAVGEMIAKRAKDAKVGQVVFDRGGFLFHGRVKALADAAREAGLDF